MKILDSKHLVFVPGLLSTEELWREVRQELKEDLDCRVTQQNLRQSSCEEMADAILAESPPNFSIVGNGLGAYVSILVAFGCLGVVSWVSKVLFKKQFFNASFTEGNSLSTLDLTTSDGIDILDNSKLLKSKSVDGNTTSYLLVSDNLGQLRQILSKCENSKHLIRYQLNA